MEHVGAVAVGHGGGAPQAVDAGAEALRRGDEGAVLAAATRVVADRLPRGGEQRAAVVLERVVEQEDSPCGEGVAR